MKRLAMIFAILICFFTFGSIVAYADDPISTKVIVDTRAPSHGLISYGEKNASNAVNFSISNISDGSNGSGIKSVSWSVTASGQAEQSGSTNVNNYPLNYNSPTYQATILDNVDYVLTLTIEDAVGNKLQESMMFGTNGQDGPIQDDVILDTTAPTAGGIVFGTKQAGDVVPFTINSISDGTGSGIARIDWSLTKNEVELDSGYKTYANLPLNITQESFSTVISTDEVYILTATIRDAVGNIKRIAAMYGGDDGLGPIHTDITLDSTPPTADDIVFESINSSGDAGFSMSNISDGSGSGIAKIVWTLIKGTTVVDTITATKSAYPLSIDREEYSYTISEAGFYNVVAEIYDYMDNVTTKTLNNVMLGIDISTNNPNISHTLSSDSLPYDGTEKKPTISIFDSQSVLTLGEDYTLAFGECINVGTVNVVATGAGIYYNTREITYDITKRLVDVWPTTIMITPGSSVPTPLAYTYTEVYELPGGSSLAPQFTGNLSTTANSSSPVGRYPIERGTLTIVNNSIYAINQIKPGYVYVTDNNGTDPIHTDVILDTTPPTIGNIVCGAIDESGVVVLEVKDVADSGTGVVSVKWTVELNNNGDYVPVVSGYETLYPEVATTDDQITINNMIPGNYRLTIEAQDAVGNVGNKIESRFIALGKATLMARESDYINTSNNRAYMIGAKRAGKAYYADQVSKVVFVDSINVPAGAVDSWDVSAEQNGCILSWIVSSGTSYIQYIGSQSDRIFAKSGGYLFADYSNMTQIEENDTVLDISDVATTNEMFLNASSLTSINLANYDTSNVINMRGMFNGASSLTTINLSTFDTSKVVNMKEMFKDCDSLTGITVTENKFDTSKVTDMSYMFSGCEHLANVSLVAGSKFATAEVTDMRSMFEGCSALTQIDLTRFDTSKVTNMASMFKDCSNLTTLAANNLETQKVEDMSSMFEGTAKLSTINVTGFNTSKVTTMANMFNGSGITSIDLSGAGFNTSNVRTMEAMFKDCNKLTALDVSGLETQNVANVSEMFSGCSLITKLDLSGFSTSSVSHMDEMFKDMSAIKTMLLGTSFDKFAGTDMLEGTSSLEAIITLSETPMLLSTSVNKNSGTILYVVNESVESVFESEPEYIAVFTRDKVRPILALIGNQTVSVGLSTTEGYVDQGATVAGYNLANAVNYTQYGFVLAETANDVDRTTIGRYHVTYTVSKSGTNLMSVTRNVDVIGTPITDYEIELGTLDSYVYDGKQKRPSVVVKKTVGTETEILSSDNYDVDYKNNTDVGTAIVIVKGKGNYYDTISKTFEITRRNLVIRANPLIYTKVHGDEDPTFTYGYTNNVLASPSDGILVDEIPGFDGALSRESGESIGQYPLTVGTLVVKDNLDTSFKANNYDIVINNTGSYLEIIKAVISDFTIDETIFEYDGQEHKPGVHVTVNGVTLVSGDDYDVTYEHAKDAGTATVTVTGKGDYEGTPSMDYVITPRRVIIIPANNSKVYGKPDPSPITSYAIKYSKDTTQAGLVTGEVPTESGELARTTGESIGSYPIVQNTLRLLNSTTYKASNYSVDYDTTKSFTIQEVPLSEFATVTLNPTTYTYDGTPKEPTATVTLTDSTVLVYGTDYYVTYEDNINVGQATANIIGMGGYTGTIRKPFTITEATITGGVVLDGTGEIGTGVVAVVTVNPSDAELTYRWYITDTSGDTVNGTLIPDENTKTLEIKEEYDGKYIYVVVNAEKPNYTETSFISDGTVGPARELTPPSTPVVTAKYNNSTGEVYTNGTWTNQNVWINVKSTDASGIAYYEYSTTSEEYGFTTMGSVSADGSSSITLNTSQNLVTYYFRSVDNSGNISGTSSIIVAIDKEAPTIVELLLYPTGWTKDSVKVTASATDSLSGINGYLFGASGANVFTEVDNTHHTSQDATYSSNVAGYIFAVRDEAGNIATREFSVTGIDNVPPVVNVDEVPTDNDEEVVVNIEAHDPDIDTNGDSIPDSPGSGIEDVTINNEDVDTTTNPSGGEEGTTTITDEGTYVVEAEDEGGNTTDVEFNVYAVYYSGNGVPGSMHKQVKYEDTSVTIKANGFITDKYTFLSWNTKADGTGITYMPGDTYSGTATIVLYAQWQKISHQLDTVVLDAYDIPFTGEQVTPQARVYNELGELLTEGIDYEVSYSNNINVGTATVIITGIGDYEGQEKVVEFNIYGVDITKNITAELDNTLFIYDGTQKRPNAIVTYGTTVLKVGVDYYPVRYENNVKAGTATATIVGKGSYYGEITLEFIIAKADRNLKAHNIIMNVGETRVLDFTYDGELGNNPPVLTSSNTTIATATVTGNVMSVRGVKEGNVILDVSIDESENYKAAEASVQVIVKKAGSSGGATPDGPLFGTILINDDAEYTVTPRTLLYISAQNAAYMYISETNTKPSADSSGWLDYSTRLPYVFSSSFGTKTIYAWFKDSNGTVSEVAYDTIMLVDRYSLDDEENGHGYDEPAHDSILYDKTEINKLPPSTDYDEFRNNGIDVKVVFNQQDVLVNETRSGVDYSTIRYGYKNLDDGSSSYTWLDSGNIITNLKYATTYEIVTEASDNAGNGPTMSMPYVFKTESKYGTSITLKDKNVQYDGLAHELDKAVIDLVEGKPLTGTLTYSYYKDKEHNTTPIYTVVTVGIGQAVRTGTAPTEPGVYYVVVTLENDNSYFDTVSENVGELRIGWYIGTGNQNVFAYIEENPSGSDTYVLHVTGDGEMKSLEDIKKQNPEVEYTYWEEYKDKITSLDIGSGSDDDIRNIGSEVFSDLPNITKIIIPDSVTKIGDGAFEGDSGVTSNIVIPAGVNQIGSNPFAGVNNTAFEVVYGNESFDTINGVLVDKDHERLISYPGGNVATQYTIPDGITTIEDAAFKDSDNLQRVIIPDGVTTIDAQAFADCDNLRIVEIEDCMNNDAENLSKVGNDAFSNISNNSIIYTFSKEIADVFEKNVDYDPNKTKVYYPPTIKVHPADANGAVNSPLKFTVVAEPGYPEDLNYKWFTIHEDIRAEAQGTGVTTDTYITNDLQMTNNGDKVFAIVYNDEYYLNKGEGHVSSNKATIHILSNAYYKVEHGTSSEYYFDNLDDAFRKAESGDKVRVIKNVPSSPGEGEAVLAGNKNVELVLNGFTINMTDKILVQSGSTLNITGNGSISKTGGYIIENAGTVTLNGSFEINNASGSGIKGTSGSVTNVSNGTINVMTNGISVADGRLNITGGSINATSTSDETYGISLTDGTRFAMSGGEITASSSIADSQAVIAAIYINENVNGRNEISGGTISATGATGVNNGSGIVNAGKSDITIQGGRIEGTKAGIENSSTNSYGDLTIRGGEVSGGTYGVLNDASGAKVIVGTEGGEVSTSVPKVQGETVAVFNTRNNNTLEFYDGKLLSHSDLIVYQCVSNTTLTIDPTAKDIYTESGHGKVKVETGYSIVIDKEGTYNRATLSAETPPETKTLQDQTVKVDERATFEVEITTEGHPSDYTFSWEVSTDGGSTWTPVTVGTGINTSTFTTPPATEEMDGYKYRCKIINGTTVSYTNAARLIVDLGDAYARQRPLVRVMYKNGARVVRNDGNNKYVDMQVIIKSYSELKETTLSFNGTTTNILASDYESTSFTVNKTASGDKIASEIHPDVFEYNYAWDIVTKVNGSMTVYAKDMNNNDSRETQTIDILYDLRVDKTISKLSDKNNDLVITFFANRPVRYVDSDGYDVPQSDLRNAENTAYSLKYTYMPREGFPETTFNFEDEFGNKASCTVDAVQRVRYKDVIFNENGTDITDLSVHDAYSVAQGLESETEVNANLDAQSRYGVNRAQIDMFMGRARDLGAADILYDATSSKTFDGVMPKEMTASEVKDEAYDYVGNEKNNYVATVGENEAFIELDKDKNHLSSEDRSYVDVITKASSLYKGDDISTFDKGDNVRPYMYKDETDKAINVDNNVNEATFRAIIVGN